MLCTFTDKIRKLFYTLETPYLDLDTGQDSYIGNIYLVTRYYSYEKKNEGRNLSF